MRRTVPLVASVAAALLFAPSAMSRDGFQQPPPAASPEPATGEAEEAPGYWQEVICRASSRPASRLRSRTQVCHTRQDWQLLADEAADEARRMQDGGRFVGAEDPLERRPGGSNPGR